MISMLNFSILRHKNCIDLFSCCFNIISTHRAGVVHQEKFWKENARLLEANNFKLLKELIKLLKNDDVVRKKQHSL